MRAELLPPLSTRCAAGAGDRLVDDAPRLPLYRAERRPVSGSGLVAIALLVLAYAAISRRLSGTVITAAMVFVAAASWRATRSSAGSIRRSRARLSAGSPSDACGRALLGRVADRPRRVAARVRRAASAARDRAAADDRGRHSPVSRCSVSSCSSRPCCSRSCLLQRTLPWGRRSSPIPAFRHAFVKGSTSRAGSTTASASRCF